eukprot:sb/3466185/
MCNSSAGARENLADRYGLHEHRWDVRNRYRMNDEYGTGEQQEEGDLGQKYKRAGLENHQGSAGEYRYNQDVSKGEYGTHTETRDHITPPPLEDTTVIRRDEKEVAEEVSPVKQPTEEPVEEELKDLVEDPAPEPEPVEQLGIYTVISPEEAAQVEKVSGEFSPPIEGGECEFVPDQPTSEAAAAEGEAAAAEDAMGVSSLQFQMSTSESNSEEVEQKEHEVKLELDAADDVVLGVNSTVTGIFTTIIIPVWPPLAREQLSNHQLVSEVFIVLSGVCNFHQSVWRWQTSCNLVIFFVYNYKGVSSSHSIPLPGNYPYPVQLSEALFFKSSNLQNSLTGHVKTSTYINTLQPL